MVQIKFVYRRQGKSIFVDLDFECFNQLSNFEM